MGREIRMVPPNWQHPKAQGGIGGGDNYKALYDEPFAAAMEQWYAGWKSWDTNPEGRVKHGCEYWEWHSGPPDPEYYRPAWPEGSATWFQIYETVSEGTPVTPPFATKAELVEYLVEHGDYWGQSRAAQGRGNKAGWTREAAEQFMASEWAPTMMVIQGGPNAGIYEAATGFPK